MTTRSRLVATIFVATGVSAVTVEKMLLGTSAAGAASGEAFEYLKRLAAGAGESELIQAAKDVRELARRALVGLPAPRKPKPPGFLKKCIPGTTMTFAEHNELRGDDEKYSARYLECSAEYRELQGRYDFSDWKHPSENA